MGRRSEHSRAELQQLIIDASSRLIDDLGVSAVTARMIAEAINYTPGMLYTVFRNLDDIFFHVSQRTLDELVERCTSTPMQKDDPQSALRQLAREYVNFAVTHPHRFDLLFGRLSAEATRIPASFHKSASGLYELPKQSLASARPTADAEEVENCTRALWCSLLGIALSNIGQRPACLAWMGDPNATDQFIDIYLRGWQA